MHNQILTGLVDLDATYIHTEYTITRLNFLQSREKIKSKGVFRYKVSLYLGFWETPSLPL